MSNHEKDDPMDDDADVTNGSKDKADGTIRIVVAEHVNDASRHPIVCSFPGGLPAALQDEQNAAPPKFLWKQVIAPASSKNPDHVSGFQLVGKDDSCQYVATATTAAMDQRRTRLCVGIYDRLTGTLTVHPSAGNGQVFALQQAVPNYQETATVNASRSMTSLESFRALYEDFGSVKKRRVIASQAANQVSVDTVIGSGNVIKSTLLSDDKLSESNRKAVQALKEEQARKDALKDNEDSDSSDSGDDAAAAAAKKRKRKSTGADAGPEPAQSAAVEAATREWRNNFLPPFREHAEDAGSVYDPYAMAGNEAWGQVSRVVDACLAKDNPIEALLTKSSSKQQTPAKDSPEKNRVQKENEDEWFPCVERILRKKILLDSPHAKLQMKCSVLLNHFMTLYSRLHTMRFIRPPDMDRSRFFGVPAESGRRFLTLFTTSMTGNDGQAGYVMSKANRDKCRVHLLILFVIASTGKSMQCDNIQPLANDLTLDVKDAVHLLRLAGFTITKKDKATKVVLKTPLSFPSSTRKSRKS